MKLIFTGILVFILSRTNAQIISQFTWESDPVTSADIGPDGTTVSASAISDVGGAGGTRGLNASLPKADINMSIPGSPTFDVAGIDISFDYHREESQCDWVRRGNSFIFDGSNQLAVSYRVDDGSGGFNTVASGNIQNIPNDDTYRNYRFIYLPVSGIGYVLVDGVVVWTNDGPDNRDMYWTGSGDVVIGGGCDGSGSNDTFMDNLIIGSVTNSGLPIELYEFTASVNESLTVDLFWSTKSEADNDYFTLERSDDAQTWEPIRDIDGAGNSSSILEYNYTDEAPLLGISYYRLKQTDFNGDFSYSDNISVLITPDEVHAFPNPTNGITALSMVGVKEEEFFVLNAQGQRLRVPIYVFDDKIEFDLSHLPKGMYFIHVPVEGNYQVEKIIVE